MEDLITKGSAETLAPKDFIEREEALSTIALRRRALMFLFWAYGGLLAMTVVIILLQGFHLFGFALQTSFLNWLGGVTLTEVASLAAIVYRFLFTRISHRDKKEKSDKARTARASHSI